jgi:hypothetical protein
LLLARFSDGVKLGRQSGEIAPKAWFCWRASERAWLGALVGTGGGKPEWLSLPIFDISY